MEKLHEWLVGDSGQSVLPVSDQLCCSVAWRGAGQCDFLLYGGICLRPLNFRFKAICFGLMLMTIMLPHHVTLIPQYIFSTIWSGSIRIAACCTEMAGDRRIFHFSNGTVLPGIAKELDEAATIDGCGPVKSTPKSSFRWLSLRW